MNPADRLNIDNFEEIVEEIARIRRHDYLSEIERKFIKELAVLVLKLPHKEAKKKLCHLRKFILMKKISFYHSPLYAAFLNASRGALDAALYCL